MQLGRPLRRRLYSPVAVRLNAPVTALPRTRIDADARRTLRSPGSATSRPCDFRQRKTVGNKMHDGRVTGINYCNVYIIQLKL